MKPQVFKICKNNVKSCLQRNSQVPPWPFLCANHLNAIISMDLIGEFHTPSAKGHRYALTVICMLTGYTFLHTT